MTAAGAAAFGNEKPRDLGQAAMRLGVRGLRDMAFAVSLTGVFRCPSLQSLVQEEIKHGFVVGVMTGYICQMMKIDANEGFLAGLFHDVGQLVVLTGLAGYGREDASMLNPDLARRVGRGSHQQLGNLLLRQWEVAASVTDCARYHHRPEKTHEPLAVVVAMADYIDEIGGDTEEERLSRLLETPCPHGPELSPAHVLALAKAADTARKDPILGAIAG